MVRIAGRDIEVYQPSEKTRTNVGGILGMVLGGAVAAVIAGFLVYLISRWIGFYVQILSPLVIGFTASVGVAGGIVNRKHEGEWDLDLGPGRSRDRIPGVLVIALLHKSSLGRFQSNRDAGRHGGSAGKYLLGFQCAFVGLVGVRIKNCRRILHLYHALCPRDRDLFPFLPRLRKSLQD